MIVSEIDSHIHYCHTQAETRALSAAVVPMMEYIVRVGNSGDRQKMRRLLDGNYFRRREALAVKAMLVRATRLARASLAEYFPSMREQIMINARNLEDALAAYWEDFERLSTQTPVTQ